MTNKRNSFIDYKRELKNKTKICVYCGEYIERKDRTVDHVIALVNGGEDVPENLTMACIKCNREKDNLYLEEYLELKKQGFDFSRRLKEKEKVMIARAKKLWKKDDVVLEHANIPIEQIYSYPLSLPNPINVVKRTSYYIDNKTFTKPTYVIELSKDRYGIIDGYINYYVCHGLSIEELPVIVVKEKTHY